MKTLQPCGTDAAYQRHKRRGERACPACREAHNATTRTGRPIGRPRVRGCGTEAGYRYHRRHGQPYCDPCREAKSAAKRARAVT